MEILADTTVFIDLWRNRSHPERLAELDAKREGYRPVLLWMMEAELLHGAVYRAVAPDAVRTFLRPYPRLRLARRHLLAYAEVAAALQKAGRSIGVADLWLAATARHENVPVLTRNVKHFECVPGLQVIGYQLVGV